MFRTIATQAQLNAWCQELQGAEWIALDTEFIAEKYYQPLLCLVQVATPFGNVLVDPLAIPDVTPFWTLLAEGEHTTIVHSGRVELEFCHRYTKKFPRHIFDTQLAAGLMGTDYPIGYSNLVFRLLDISPTSTEGRTDWSCRPLSPKQVEYAMDDIRHLNAMRGVLTERLAQLGRLEWLNGETEHWLEGVRALVAPDRWRRLLGGGRYDRREMAIIRELWHWREEVGQRRNSTVRRVLRDDLLLELARHKTFDIKVIRNIRGMEREDLRKQLPYISESISRALKIPEAHCPEAITPAPHVKVAILSTVFSAVLSTICHDLRLAPTLVATISDVREWLAWRLGLSTFDRQPLLATGWRAEVVGQLFDELLSGQKQIHITAPTDESPLAFR